MPRGLSYCASFSVPMAVLAVVLGAGCACVHQPHQVRIKPKPMTLSPAELSSSAELDEGEQSAEAVVATLKHGTLSVIATAQDISQRRRRDMDEVIIVLSGEGVSELNGTRTPVSQGCVIVIPRKTTFRFHIRGDSPVKLLSILIPPKKATEQPAEEPD